MSRKTTTTTYKLRSTADRVLRVGSATFPPRGTVDVSKHMDDAVTVTKIAHMITLGVLVEM